MTVATDANISSDVSSRPKPVALHRIVLGPAMQLLNPGDLGLDSVPDVQLSEIRQPDGGFVLWIGGSVDKTEGSVAMLWTADFATFAPVVGDGGAATPVFTASAPATVAVMGAPGRARSMPNTPHQELSSARPTVTIS